jgi:hypothetical protein
VGEERDIKERERERVRERERESSSESGGMATRVVASR